MNMDKIKTEFYIKPNIYMILKAFLYIRESLVELTKRMLYTILSATNSSVTHNSRSHCWSQGIFLRLVSFHV